MMHERVDSQRRSVVADWLTRPGRLGTTAAALLMGSFVILPVLGAGWAMRHVHRLVDDTGTSHLSNMTAQLVEICQHSDLASIEREIQRTMQMVHVESVLLLDPEGAILAGGPPGLQADVLAADPRMLSTLEPGNSREERLHITELGLRRRYHRLADDRMLVAEIFDPLREVERMLATSALSTGVLAAAMLPLGLIAWLLLRRYRTRLLQARNHSTVGALAASIAHDVRNPLASVITAAELLHEQPLNADDLQLVDDIRLDAQRASDQLDGLLDLMRSQSLRPKLCRLDEPVRDACRMIAHQARARGIRMELPEPCQNLIRVDQRRFRQALVNLLMNALEACPEGNGSIRVYVDETMGRILIEDNGPGMSRSQLRRIGRGLSSGKPHGTGLGAAIARETVERHHGSISWRRSASGGTCVTIELPLEPIHD